MITNLFWILNYIREELLEKFILPELDISYWKFLIILAMVSVVVAVLINSVRVSGSAAFSVGDSEFRKERFKKVKSGFKSTLKKPFSRKTWKPEKGRLK